MSDDTPTQRSDAPLTPSTPTSPSTPPSQPDQEKKKSNRLIIALIVIGAAILIALILLLIALFAGASKQTAAVTSTQSATLAPTTTPIATASASATPTPTATPSPSHGATSAPPPPSNAPVIGSFAAASTVVYCNTSAPAGDHQPISFSWSSTNGSQVFFGVDTNDASSAPLFENLPPTGNSNDDFPAGYNHGAYEYPCTAPSTTFTLTVVGNGKKVSKSVTIINKGDK
jgi:hypothetical protein